MYLEKLFDATAGSSHEQAQETRHQEEDISAVDLEESTIFFLIHLKNKKCEL